MKMQFPENSGFELAPMRGSCSGVLKPEFSETKPLYGYAQEASAGLQKGHGCDSFWAPLYEDRLSAVDNASLFTCRACRAKEIGG